MTAFFCWLIVGILNIFRFSHGEKASAFDYWICYICLMVMLVNKTFF